MSDYPNPDEEYELMYADELEMLDEESSRPGVNAVRKKPLPAKRSLDFSGPFTENAVNNVEVNNVSATTTIPLDPPGSEEITLTPSIPIEDLMPSTNKRTADELFGDIEDIDFNEIEMPSKKQKTEEEVDLDLIDKILEGRRLKQILAEPTSRLLSNKSSYKVKENLSLDIPRWAFMPLTNSDGDRIYVKFESEESWENSLDFTSEKNSLHSTYASTWSEARKILETRQQQQSSEEHLSQALPDIDEDMNNNMLWVDKYRPTSYLDLLSEEPVNRTLLHWLHLWDKIVFKKEVKTKEPQQRTTFSKRAGQFQLMNKWKGKKEAEPEMDEDGRPHHKVALLCGPPGVGKTTLAHLLARIAGYRPVELNASDERSTEAFRNAIQSATLMRSVLDADRRPNCLILDEIDGAPLPTVELLVRWCTATASEGKGKSKTKVQPLRRPIIAICNDLYATSLRPLRPVSLVVQVGGVSIPRLAARLSHVCAREGLTVAPHVAAALAARAQGDVRAAIQVLSFIKAKAKQQLNMADVENAAIGTKDCNKSLMQALQAVFTVNDKDPKAILRTVNAAGEYDRLADGIFEHYISARVDGRLRIACETLTWLVLQDTISSWTSRTQNYSLYSALPLCIASCHTVLASRTPQRMFFPKQAMEMYRKKVELDSIVSTVERGSSPSVSKSRPALRFDFLPLAPYLLTPQLRSANVQFCSEMERKTVRVCASAMCDYGLKYVQHRTPDGVYNFVLEPDVNRVAFFGSEDKIRPPPAVRQAIAREQQLEIIRRNEEMANRVPARSKSDVEAQPTTSKKEDNSSGTGKTKEGALPNHLQRLKPKEITKSTPQVHKDFFGRIVPIVQTQRSDAVSDVIASSSVFYQYQEGFNNAVRRNVRTKDLL